MHFKIMRKPAGGHPYHLKCQTLIAVGIKDGIWKEVKAGIHLLTGDPFYYERQDKPDLRLGHEWIKYLFMKQEGVIIHTCLNST